jgi:hypothetical protein
MGDGVGFGLQGLAYQYKVTGHGVNLFTIIQDMSYVLNGSYSGRTMLSSLLWIIGSLCTIIATIVWLVNGAGISRINEISGTLLITGTIIYLLSAMFQYGVLLHGAAGISIPFGIPLLIFVGYIMIKFKPNDCT